MSVCTEATIQAIEARLRLRRWTVKDLSTTLRRAPATIRCGLWCLRVDRKVTVHQRPLRGLRTKGSGRQVCEFWIAKANQ